MKKYTLIFLLTGILFTTVFISCSDDFVETKPQYSIDSENYFNSEDDYYNALVAAYDLLQSTYQNALLGEIASDNTFAGGNGPNDVPGYQSVDDMIHTPVNEQLKQFLQTHGYLHCPVTPGLWKDSASNLMFTLVIVDDFAICYTKSSANRKHLICVMHLIMAII